MYISIEIVPRTTEHITEELELVCEHLPKVNMINIPDLVRFKTRSWDACALAKPYYQRRIPHIRAVDFSLDDAFPLVDDLAAAEIDELLIVSGDTDKTSMRTVYNTSSVTLIRKLKKELPHLKLYAAIDPYRQGFHDEINYIHEKIDAGADGFFTQPFFDIRMMEIYAELIPEDTEVYWGITPVLRENSKNYWENVNRTVFPADFDLSLEWNRQFARNALDFVADHNGHIYFMPIRADLVDYLGGIL